MFEGYLSLGCNEILNQQRAYSYINGGDCPLGWIRCIPCPTLSDALGIPEPDGVVGPDAPWYDAEDEATHRFYGLYPIAMEGLSDSTRTATVTEGILDGGVVSGIRHAVREVRVRALAVAKGQDALESGIAWLDHALEPDECSTHGASCGAVDAQFFASCPPPRGVDPDYSPWELVALNIATNPSMTVPGPTVAVQTNLATNPSFETASNAVEVRRNSLTNPRMDNLIAAWSTTAPVAQTAAAGGTIITFPSAATTLTAAFYSSPITAVGGEQWYAGIDVTVPAGQPAGTFVVNTRGYSTGGSTTGGTDSSPVTIQPGQTARLVAPVLGPVSADTVSVRLWLSVVAPGVAAGSQITVKNAILEKSSINTMPYFDGTNRPHVRDNLAVVPTPTATYPYNSNSGAAYPVVFDPTGGRRAGTGASSQTRTTTTPSNSIASWYNVGGSLYNNAGRPKASAGITYTASAYAKTTLPNARLQAQLWFFDSAGVAIGAPASSAYLTMPTASTWYRQSITVVAPAGTVGMVGSVTIVGPTGYTSVGGEKSWTTDVLIEEGTALGDYFDGATAVAPYTPAWSGAADVSPSYLYDTDLTASWTGTANASASIVSGAGVAGTGGTFLTNIQSTHWASTGTKSDRLISNYGSNNSRAVLQQSFPVVAGEVYTIQAKFRLAAPLTGALLAQSRMLSAWFAGSGTMLYSTAAPNTAGVHNMRHVVTVPAGNTTMDVRAYLGAPPGGGDMWVDDLVIIRGEYTGPYFDGSTPAADGFTFAWTGTANASTSVQQAVAPINVGVPPTDQAALYQSSDTPLSGPFSARVVTKTAGAISIPVTNSLPVTGANYTLLMSVRPVSRDLNGSLSIRGAVGPEQSFPEGTWTTARLSIPAGSGTAIQTGLFLNGTTSGQVAGDLIDIDNVLLIEGDYAGDYFDGDNPSTDLERYEWVGGAAPAATAWSVRNEILDPWTDEEYAERVDPLIRLLHGVSAISGPFVTEQMRRGEYFANIVEFTLVASTPFVFGLPRDIELFPTPSGLIEDIPLNLAPYPSAELQSATQVVTSKNYSTNPSVETDITGWNKTTDNVAILAATVAAPTRSTETSVVGVASAKTTFTAGTASATGGWFALYQTVVGLPAVTTGMRVSVNIWASANTQAGNPVYGPLDVYAIWQDGASATLRTDTIGTITGGSGVATQSGIVPPAGTTQVQVRVRQYLNSWDAATIVRLYADALAVTVP